MGIYYSTAPTLVHNAISDVMVDTTGAGYANNEGRKATYRAITTGVGVTANGAFLSLQGSATKVIRVTRITVGGILTTAAQVSIIVSRTTAAVSSAAGTAAITPRGLASANAAATASVNSYTSSTLGTGNVTVGAGRAFFAPASAVATPIEFLYGGRNSQSLVISGTAEFCQVSCTASSYIGAGFDIDVEFTEE